MRMLPFLALAAGCSGCSGATPTGRDAVLVEWFHRDNAIWLDRHPALLAGKYERMRSDPYDFMRGTAGLFHEDLARLGAERPPTGFLTEPGETAILVIGDPHPENLSTFLPGAGPPDRTGPPPPLVVAWADMDAATYGAWTADVRRAAQGLSLFLADFDGCDADCRANGVVALAGAYATTLERRADDAPTPLLEDALRGNPYVDDLRNEALEEGLERNRYGDTTQRRSDPAAFATRDAPDEDGRGLVRVTPGERQVATRVFAAWAADRPGARRLDVARRFGQGVSSRPALRFLVLWDHGQDGPDDDEILNLREVLDPPPVPARGLPLAPVFDDNADRIRTASATLWPAPDLDADADAVTDGPATWKTLDWSSFYQGLDHGKAAEVWADNPNPATVEALGTGIGFALADAHARSTTVDGTPALDVLAPALAGQGEALAAELVPLAEADRARTLEDFDRFNALLDTLGPRLGIDPILGSP